MLANFPAMATLPTADMARARAFYEGLGFPVVREGDELQGTMFQAGSTPFLVFATPNAGTNHATAMAFTVSDEGFAGEIEGLRANGVKFMTFDAPTGSWSDGVLTDEPGDAL
ncbi:MAG: VOC family protein, partial [Cellulomonas sp.]|nr:VOC family protein [Cellulomonas sp.]